jgi:ATP-dependent Lon protease
MAYDYLKANAKKIGIDRDVGAYDFNIQVMSLMQGKDATDLGVAFYIGLISAMLGRQIGGGLVILGQMSIHGVLSRVEGLGDKLRIAMDAGAKRVMFPTENRRDFAELPPEIIDKLQIDFYSDPSQAAFKALVDTEEPVSTVLGSALPVLPGAGSSPNLRDRGRGNLQLRKVSSPEALAVTRTFAEHLCL